MIDGEVITFKEKLLQSDRRCRGTVDRISAQHIAPVRRNRTTGDGKARTVPGDGASRKEEVTASQRR